MVWHVSCQLDVFDRGIGEVIGIGLFLPLFCEVDLEISNGLMPAAGEHVMEADCL